MTGTNSDLQKLAQIVREVTGNNIQEKNYSMLESRIRGHMMKIGIEDFEAYWKHFHANEKLEREVLQGLMTTHYTFFFREFVHFETLNTWIETNKTRLKSRYEKDKSPVRIWSAACSRGQEVYSLAMFLELNLFQKYQIPFEVVGTDIDPESVSIAKNGVYPIKEVNTIAQMYLHQFWKKGTGQVADFAAANKTLRARTSFDTANLLQLSDWKYQHKVDVIFCRNVFIYFTEENVKKITIDLLKRLDQDGLLVSGLSEPLRFKDIGIEAAGPSSYRKVGSKSSAAPTIPAPAVGKTSSPAPTPMSAKNPSVGITPTPLASLPQESFSEPKYKVLCVDDSSTIQTLMKKIFSQDPNCVKIDTALNGQEARKMLDAGKYDVMTLDIHMPVMSGIEFLERAYNRRQDPPVIMVSSVNRTDIDLATRSISLGAFDYVEKPAMNNLQKCADEILIKVKMALRTKPEVIAAAQPTVGSFDAEIGQKIVVPDASQCARIVMASEKSMRLLEYVVKGQAAEFRSPPLIILWKDPGNGSVNLEKDLLTWTSRAVVYVRDGNTYYRPNSVYIVPYNLAGPSLKAIKAKSHSLQVLDQDWVLLDPLKSASNLQVLLDETLTSQSSRFESFTGLRVSDITPATSFPSLSVEFFANLRKAA